MMKALTILVFACGALLAGCAEGPVHYSEGGEVHGNTPHNDDARTEFYGSAGDHDRQRNDDDHR